MNLYTSTKVFTDATYESKESMFRIGTSLAVWRLRR